MNLLRSVCHDRVAKAHHGNDGFGLKKISVLLKNSALKLTILNVC